MVGSGTEATEGSWGSGSPAESLDTPTFYGKISQWSTYV